MKAVYNLKQVPFPFPFFTCITISTHSINLPYYHYNNNKLPQLQIKRHIHHVLHLAGGTPFCHCWWRVGRTSSRRKMPEKTLAKNHAHTRPTFPNLPFRSKNVLHEFRDLIMTPTLSSTNITYRYFGTELLVRIFRYFFTVTYTRCHNTDCGLISGLLLLVFCLRASSPLNTSCVVLKKLCILTFLLTRLIKHIIQLTYFVDKQLPAFTSALSTLILKMVTAFV